MRPRVTEQSLIDAGHLLTREDAAILARIGEAFRHHYRYGDAIDGALMALAEAKSELKREVARFIGEYKP